MFETFLEKIHSFLSQRMRISCACIWLDINRTMSSIYIYIFTCVSPLTRCPLHHLLKQSVCDVFSISEREINIHARVVIDQWENRSILKRKESLQETEIQQISCCRAYPKLNLQDFLTILKHSKKNTSFRVANNAYLMKRVWKYDHSTVTLLQRIADHYVVVDLEKNH